MDCHQAFYFQLREFGKKGEIPRLFPSVTLETRPIEQARNIIIGFDCEPNIGFLERESNNITPAMPQAFLLQRLRRDTLLQI